MSVAFDAASGPTTNATVTSVTLSHTCTGSNRYLIALTYLGSGHTMTSVTYAGVAMTQLCTDTAPNSTIGTLWGLSNPATGANNIIATPDSSAAIGISAVSYTGVGQTQPDSSSHSNGTSTSVTQSTTVVDSGCWTVLGVQNQTNDSAGTGSTQRVAGGASGRKGLYDSNATVSTGSQSMTVNFDNGGYTALMVSITPLNRYVMTGVKGTYTYTGFNSTFLKAHNYVMTLAVGVYTYTGNAASFVGFLWTRLTKKTSSQSNGNKNSSSWTDTTKNNSSMNNQNKT